MFFTPRFKQSLPSKDQALPGRSATIPVAKQHVVLETPMEGPWPEGMQQVTFGMGCFWGVERIFWKLDGVHSTATGYAAGHTTNPTYREVCSGRTGHNEVVQVIFDPTKISFTDLLRAFWEGHDPTQGMRQGNDAGTQYRSGIYTSSDEQKQAALKTRAAYQEKLTAAGLKTITTEIIDAGPFYYAEDYHQQYLHKNPGGYCGLGGTGVSCPVGVEV
ncbi:MAG: peptide-methionine (S)-S-oxide reductase [Myxococcota bacterium]|jgi:peptide-methionine (S)-S-oxide reductase